MDDQSNEPDEPYEVGYGKPPKEHQFPPGKSGNPKGRPKGAKSMKTIYTAVFNKLMTLKLDGKIQKMTPKEVALYQQAKKAMNGDQKATELMLRLEDRYAPPDETVTSEDIETDINIIQNLIKLYGDEVEEDHDDD